jgi:hypothetical protein
MLAAFVYRDYYCYGIKDSFRGLYSDKEDALSVIRGTRDDYVNMELMDMETAGIEKYNWIPLYDLNGTGLTHSWDKSRPEIVLEWDGDVRKYGHNNIFYEAGEWKLKR